MKVAVLALQGAFAEHELLLAGMGISTVELRQKRDLLSSFDGLVLPGGESTVQGKLLNELDMMNPIRDLIHDGMPVLGTCAGMILLARSLSNDPSVYLGTLPITVKRNAYGRQTGSFRTIGHSPSFGEFPMTFIRAPYIEASDPSVEVLATDQEKAVAVRYQNQIALAFHPELDACPIFHKIMLGL